MSTFDQVIIFLIESVANMIIFFVMLRFVLQLVRANFFHPVSQMVVSFSEPFVRPLRRVIPVFNGFCLGTLLSAYTVSFTKHFILAYFYRPAYGSMHFLTVMSLSEIGHQFFDIFFFAVIIRIALTWLELPRTNPLVEILCRITDPLLIRAQRYVQPINGIDLSPIPVLILLQVGKILLP